MRLGIASLAGIAAGLGLMLAPGAASAAKVTVSTTTDEFGGSVECSLRDAVQSANTDTSFGGCERTGTGSRDTIRLVGGSNFAREIDVDFEDANAGGDLDLTGKTTMKVIGKGIATIDANDMDRGIDLRGGASLTASNLLIVDGEQAFSTSLAHTGGGGIRVNQGAKLELSSSEVRSSETLGNGGAPNGGGLRVSGTATLRKVLVSQNTSSGVGGGIALLTNGELTVLRSTIDANRSDGSGGGGIYLSGNGNETAKIIRSTISRNHSSNAMFGNGGGINSNEPLDPADFSLTNVTISGNTAVQDGGGIYAGSGNLKVNAATITDNTTDYEETGAGDGGGIAGFGAKVKNSIVADNYSPLVPGNEQDCADLDLGGTHNLIGDDTGCFEDGQVVAAEPKLGTLADNGGPTLTHKLLKGSPAIGVAGGNTPAKDQRGAKRDAHPDAGAYER